MTSFRRALREALGIALSASLLGLGFSFFTERGLFSHQGEQSELPAATSPSMIHLPQARAYFESGDAYFIDSRHAFDFQRGHIPGAVNIPLAEVDAHRDLIASLPPEKVLIVYCDGAECNSSIELATRLAQEGFKDVKIFFGGWNEWYGNNLPSEGRDQ